MRYALAEQYHCDLEAQLQRLDVRQEIEWLRETYPVFAKYSSAEALCALVRPGNPNYSDKDAVLGILLAKIKNDREKRTLFPLLNLMFWGSLMNIFWRKQMSVPNPDELFSHIQADFCHTALTYPLDRRPRKIDVNLILDTKKRVTAWQRQEATYHEYQRRLEPADEACIRLVDPRIAEVHPEDMESYLLGFVYHKVINEMQYDLLLETEVYRRMTEKEWAKAHGVKYATARSWRHRAEKDIREYEEARRERIAAERP